MRLCLAAALLAFPLPALAAEPVIFAHGTAIYDLSATGAGAAAGVTLAGKMTSSFLQPECGAYQTSAEMQIEVGGPGGFAITQDLEASYLERPDSLRFDAEQRMMGATLDSAHGLASRDGDGLTVSRDDSAAASERFEGPIVFPVEMIRRLIEAGREGDAFSTYLLFDGTTAGGSLLTVSAVIGPAESGPVAGTEGALIAAVGWDGLQRWPVTLTYFEDGVAGERQPAMSITMKLLENGFGIETVYQMGPLEMALEMVSLQPVEGPICT